MSEFGVISIGIKCPIIKEGDNLNQIVLDSILKTAELEDGDIIGVTESVVARAFGMYVTVDEITKDIESKFGEKPTIALIEPIYSRNRFSMILKGIARACKKIILVMPDYDEVGNPRGVNPFTGVNIEEYYSEICKSENCEIVILYQLRTSWDKNFDLAHLGIDYIKEPINGYIDCRLHQNKISSLVVHNWYKFWPCYLLSEICKDKNPDYGLLGTNKATEETLKLFPSRSIAQSFADSLQKDIKIKLGKTVEVMVYGDGCFKDPVGGIWEFADPVVSPGYTEGLNGTPNEIKIKAFADDEFKDLTGDELIWAIKSKIKEKEGNLKGQMSSQGTTPRRFVDLLGSLMDLTSGSGDRGTPVVLVKNYFKNYAN